MTDSQLLTRALAAATEFFAALHSGEWEQAANMVDGDTAEAFRDSELASLVAWAQHRPQMIESRARKELFGWSSDGKLHPELAAQFADTRLPGVTGIQTLGQLVSMSTIDFVATSLQLGNELPDEPNEEGPDSQRRVLGGVVEGNAMVHVLHRREDRGYEYTDPHHVDVVRFVAREGVWRVDLTTFDQDIAIAHSLMMLADLSRFAPDGDVESRAPDA